MEKTMRSLEAKGYLELSRGRSRSITLHRRANGRRFSGDTVWAPVVGQNAPPESSAIAEAIELARSMLGKREDVYALKIRGQSMSDALVRDGDVVILARTSAVANGELAAIRVIGKDGHKNLTLKYFYRENGHVRLQPAHPDMPPLFYKPEHVVVHGRVVLVIRQAG
jgi:repressor LexA